jgi:hypothetical protein
MSLNKNKIWIAIPLLAALFTACQGPRNMQTETKTVDLGGAARVEARISMGAGELRLRGADQPALLDASFEFNRERQRPEVDYRLLGDKGILEVRHARHRGFNFGTTRNRWDLALGNAVPLDLNIDLGAGRSELDLRGLKLQRVEIDMGVGETDLDLRGPHAASFHVKIDGGVGSGKLRLPSEVGVRVKVDGGLGSVDAHGLTKQNGAYVNEAYGKSGITIEVDIDAGIGSLDLSCEPSGLIKT